MIGKRQAADNHRPLKIMIVGCGKVGSTLVEQLTQEGNDITLIDENRDKIENLTNLYDTMGYVGNGASYSLLKEAGIDEMDLMIAVTNSDELNLLCCTLAKRVGNCAAIARVRKPDYMGEVHYLRDRLGLAMIINPELEAAAEMARILYLPSALEVNSFAHGEAELIKFKVTSDCQLCNKTVSDFTRGINEHMIFSAVERAGNVFIPNGAFTFLDEDIVSFVTTRRSGRKCMQRLGIPTGQVRDCMIIGGGDASYYLASHLIKANINVKIIEKNKARCEELSLLLPEAIIICGDGTDTALLVEEGIETTEAFVPLTGMDEENIMLTLYAKRFSNAKVITKINRISFPEVVNSLDLGSVIYPRYITSEAIIAYARARRASVENTIIETLYHLFDQRAEAIEFLITEESAATGTPLMKLNLKDNLIITFISRNGQIILPKGSDTIEVGDSVMVTTTHSHFSDISDILA
ncbi:MAG: Trk system potassium transporter TrkA [Lachnospiraceae bacterium]|nr:Trk system potassium transporter TrkA [Lachnospiraceae bacterium]